MHLLTKRLAALKRSRCQFSFIPVCISRGLLIYIFLTILYDDAFVGGESPSSIESVSGCTVIIGRSDKRTDTCCLADGSCPTARTTDIQRIPIRHDSTIVDKGLSGTVLSSRQEVITRPQVRMAANIHYLQSHKKMQFFLGTDSAEYFFRHGLTRL